MAREILWTGALATGICAAPSRGQDLPLPDPQFSVQAGFEQIRTTWPEVAQNAGRRAVIDSLVNWEADSSSTVQIVGDYVGECDFRLSLRRLPQDNALGVNLRIVARLFNSEEELTSSLVAIDSMNVFEPGVTYAFDPSLAPNLGVRFSSNVNQPPPLGTIPVTVGGLNTSLSRSSTYAVTALNSVTDFPFASDSLVVKVLGPTTTTNDSTIVVTNPPSTTLVVREVGQVMPIMNGMTISFGAGSAAAGDSAHWSARYIFAPGASVNVNLESFEGYHLWRSDLPDLSSFSLLGEIRICESKFEFALLNEEEIDASRVSLDYDPASRTFTFVDRDVHNDFPYQYSVTTFDRGFLGNELNLVFEGTRRPSQKLYPGRLSRDVDEVVFVVPNPYIRHAAWEEGEPKVVFTNLPPSCTIRVFTESADHVVTFEHGPDQPRSTSATTVTWDLKTDGGEDIVPGVYIYFVEGSGYQGTGKMMVAR
jgi:hypothetical protein